jgi:CubicO group peptidase (beta-lactamase class C family)
MRMDSASLARAVVRIRSGAYPGMHSMLVIRYGYVVVEEYFDGWTADRLHTMQSVSKSVTSLVVGALGERIDIDAPVWTSSSDAERSSGAGFDSFRDALTARHLLSMRTGMPFHETPYAGSPLQQLNDCRCDWVDFMRSQPVDEQPGTSWRYNSGGVIVLGDVIRRASGERADSTARRLLFEKIGISRFSWVVDVTGRTPHMGGGLALTSSDLARIGYLVLRNGRWNEQQVVPAAWIAQSTDAITKNIPGYFGRPVHYGMLWWRFPRSGSSAVGTDDIIAASGSGGQWLFIDRRNDLVVVFNATLGSRGWAGLELMFGEVLPAVRLSGPPG